MTTYVTPFNIDDDDDKDGCDLLIESVKKQKKKKKKQEKKSSWELDHEAKERILTAVFTYRQSGIEAQLDEYSFTWRFLDSSHKASKKGKKSKDDTELDIKTVYAAKIRRQGDGKKGQASEGPCVGFTLYSYERKGCKFKPKEHEYDHPSQEICIKWTEKINSLLAALERPKCIKVFLQPKAGIKAVGHYNQTVRPIFELCDIDVDLTEIKDGLDIDKAVADLDVIRYDCVVIVGGDGTSNAVINAMINKAQLADIETAKIGFNATKCDVPIGIIPVGVSNTICNSVQGVADPYTATVHIVLGQKVTVDTCAIFDKEHLYRWSFNSNYGLIGNAHKKAKRLENSGLKRVEAAFLKTLKYSKLASYEIEVKYVPSQENLLDNCVYDGVVCKRGCHVCKGNREDNSVHSDDIVEFDPLANSGNSSTLLDLAQHESPWKTIKGNFFNVGIFTLPGHSPQASRGQSKYTHLTDGCIDLVVIRETEKKNFIRFLKRHGNAKNQFDFPFVETYRCKEVQFHQRIRTTWKHKDYDICEIEQRELMQRQKRRDSKINNDSPNQIKHEIVLDDDEDDISDDDDDDDDDSFPDIEDMEDLEDLSDVMPGAPEKPSSGKSSSSASTNATPEKNKKDINRNNRKSSSADKRRSSNVEHVPVNRLTFYEKEYARRAQKREKKAMKLKNKEETATRSVWSVDSEVLGTHDFSFYVYSNLLQLYGQGIYQDHEFEDSYFTKLPTTFLR